MLVRISCCLMVRHLAYTVQNAHDRTTKRFYADTIFVQLQNLVSHVLGPRVRSPHQRCPESTSDVIENLFVETRFKRHSSENIFNLLEGSLV